MKAKKELTAVVLIRVISAVIISITFPAQRDASMIVTTEISIRTASHLLCSVESLPMTQHTLAYSLDKMECTERNGNRLRCLCQKLGQVIENCIRNSWNTHNYIKLRWKHKERNLGLSKDGILTLWCVTLLSLFWFWCSAPMFSKLCVRAYEMLQHKCEGLGKHHHTSHTDGFTSTGGKLSLENIDSFSCLKYFSLSKSISCFLLWHIMQSNKILIFRAHKHVSCT